MKTKKDQIGSRDSGQMFIVKFYNRKSKANLIGLLRIGFYTSKVKIMASLKCLQ